MSILTLSGWAQPADALTRALDIDAATFDYSAYANPNAAFEAMRGHADADHVIGWSMGGQLALGAIAAGVLKPRKLTLIAAPYQFVSSENFSGGMDPITYAQFRESYAKDPARTKKRFHALIGKGDADRTIVERLDHHPQVDDTTRWLPWLDFLGAASHRDTDLSSIPETTIIHGTGDAIVPIAQGEKLAAILPKSRLIRWDDTGHAPHLRDKARLVGAL